MKWFAKVLAAGVAAIVSLSSETALSAEVPQEMTLAASSNFWIQVDAINERKEGSSEAESKIDSQFLYCLRASDPTKPSVGFSTAVAKTFPTPGESVECNISCTVSDRLLAALSNRLVRIVSVSKTFGAIHAFVPLLSMGSVAEDPDVRAIRRVIPGWHNAATTSEGVTAHRVNSVKTSYGATGKGMSVGVISDGCDDLASLKSSGDLPSDAKKLPGYEGSGYEGGAMMEVVHDLAPAAKLTFAHSGSTCEEFAEAILALRQSGCNIIFDDVFRGDDPAFEEGAIAQAINTVTAAGAVYVTSACNYGRRNIETAQVWNGDFNPVSSNSVYSKKQLTYKNCQLHAFNPSIAPGYSSIPLQAVNTFEDVDSTAQAVAVMLQWSDKWGSSSNDYDLYVVNYYNGNVIASSTNVQGGKGDPFEILYIPTSVLSASSSSTLPVILVVKKTSSQIRFFRLSVTHAKLGIATEGSITGHNGCESAITCAAASVPEESRAFTSSDELEDFSSDGPCYRFFKANGNPYTAGSFTKSGVKALNKPDVTAADQVSCSATGFETFYGTSAAAPHVAAIAALMLEVNPSLTPAELKTLMTKSTFSSIYSWNRNSGYGIVDALKCAQAAKASVNKTYTVRYVKNDGTSTSSAQTIAVGAARNLFKVKTQLKWSHSGGKRFAGWKCSNGKRYDDGILVFNLAKSGGSVTMTAIWE